MQCRIPRDSFKKQRRQQHKISSAPWFSVVMAVKACWDLTTLLLNQSEGRELNSFGRIVCECELWNIAYQINKYISIISRRQFHVLRIRYFFQFIKSSRLFLMNPGSFYRTRLCCRRGNTRNVSIVVIEILQIMRIFPLLHFTLRAGNYVPSVCTVASTILQL